MMSILIRPFKIQDYPAINVVGNAAYPEYRLTLEKECLMDEQRDPNNHFARWVAELRGRIVGVGQYNQTASLHHEGEFWIDVYAHPDYEGQGIAAALYRNVLQALKPLSPMLMRTNIRESMTQSFKYLHTRGFQEQWRRANGWGNEVLGYERRSVLIGMVKHFDQQCPEPSHTMPQVIAV